MNNFKLQKLPLNIDLNKEINNQLLKTSRALATLNGCLYNIPNPKILISTLNLQEAKDSNEIENIITTCDELFMANINENEPNKNVKEVQNYEKALNIGYELLQQNNLILNSHLKQIQEILVQNKAGFRTQCGTTLKNQKSGEIIYIPPQSIDEINDLMANLERYINDDLDELDPLIKLAIIHFQFESIHPFYDGNGRCGRILNILYLVKMHLLDLPILYLSDYIICHKAKYYELLQSTKENNDFSEWILFILKGIELTSIKTKELIYKINFLIDETIEILQKNTKFYSFELVELMFFYPYIKSVFIENKINISRQTASKYLKTCEKLGILKCVKKGQNNYYVNIKLFELFSKN